MRSRLTLAALAEKALVTRFRSRVWVGASVSSMRLARTVRIGSSSRCTSGGRTERSEPVRAEEMRGSLKRLSTSS